MPIVCKSLETRKCSHVHDLLGRSLMTTCWTSDNSDIIGASSVIASSVVCFDVCWINVWCKYCLTARTHDACLSSVHEFFLKLHTCWGDTLEVYARSAMSYFLTLTSPKTSTRRLRGWRVASGLPTEARGALLGGGGGLLASLATLLPSSDELCVRLLCSCLP